MADTLETAELVVGLTISVGALAARLVTRLRDAGAITAQQADDIIASLAEQQREMARQPGVAGGAATVYTSVADTLDAARGRFTGSSAPSS